MTWNVVRYKYYNFGAIYLTEQQRAANQLLVVVNIQDYEPEISQSFLRNPPQSVYGYTTIGFREGIVREVQQRYPGQIVLDYVNTAAIVQREICRAANYLVDQLRPPPGEGPDFIQLPGSLAPFDSLRFKSTNESNFEFIVWWDEVPENTGLCDPTKDELPDAPQTPNPSPPPGPPSGYIPPTVPAEPNGGSADVGLTPRPEGSPAGDFDPANAASTDWFKYQLGPNYVTGFDNSGLVPVCLFNGPVCFATPLPVQIISETPNNDPKSCGTTNTVETNVGTFVFVGAPQINLISRIPALSGSGLVVVAC